MKTKVREHFHPNFSKLQENFGIIAEKGPEAATWKVELLLSLSFFSVFSSCNVFTACQ